MSIIAVFNRIGCGKIILDGTSLDICKIESKETTASALDFQCVKQQQRTVVYKALALTSSGLLCMKCCTPSRLEV